MNRPAVALGLALAAGCGSPLPESEPVRPLDAYELSAPVEVVIDEHGVPHLYAADDLDAFFAEGYQEATDALFALEITRRQSLGTLAEVLGDDARTSDVQSRTFGFARWGAESVALLAQTQPEVHNAVVAYVAGVNRRIAEVNAGSAPLPAEFALHGFAPEPWSAADSLAIGIRIQFGFSATLSFDLLNTLLDRLVPERDQIPIFAPYGSAFFASSAAVAAWHPPLAGDSGPAGPELDAAEARAFFRGLAALDRNHGTGEGSNNWAVRGEHTDNGRPLLANDSHAGLTSPNRMHLHHLDSASAGGSLDVVGFSFLGLPAVHVGHNRRVAWGATTNFADTMDVWEVEIDGDEVLLGGERSPLEATTQTLRVRETGGGVREEALELRSVPGRGVLLPPEALPLPKVLITGTELMVGWPGLSATDELAQFLGFDRARTLDELDSAVRLGRTGMQNWVSASASGIRMRAHGLVPDRGAAGSRPRANALLDGADPSTFWSGAMLPEEQLPHLDGSQAFIVTANDDPWGHTADNDPLNDAFYYGSFFSPGIRAHRLGDWFAARIPAGGITRDEMHALQTDVTSTLGLELVPLLSDAVSRIGTDPELSAFENRPELAAAAQRLEAWDKRTLRSSEEAALLRVFLAFLSRATLEPALGLLFDGIDEAQPVTMQKLTMLLHLDPADAVTSGKQRLLLVTALSDALAEIEQRTAGGSSYTWGDLHRAVFRDMVDGETLLPTDGDDSSINVAQCRCWDGEQLAEHCRSTAGAVYRWVVGFDDDGTPRATFSTPMANAGVTEDWVEGRYQPLHFRRADVDGARAERRTLEP